MLECILCSNCILQDASRKIWSWFPLFLRENMFPLSIYSRQGPMRKKVITRRDGCFRRLKSNGAYGLALAHWILLSDHCFSFVDGRYVYNDFSWPRQEELVVSRTTCCPVCPVWSKKHHVRCTERSLVFGWVPACQTCVFTNMIIQLDGPMGCIKKNVSLRRMCFVLTQYGHESQAGCIRHRDIAWLLKAVCFSCVFLETYMAEWVTHHRGEDVQDFPCFPGFRAESVLYDMHPQKFVLGFLVFCPKICFFLDWLKTKVHDKKS